MEARDVELRADGSAVLHVRRGKGDRPRFVGLDKRSAKPIREVMRGPTELLVRTNTGGQVWPSSVRRIIRRLSQKAGQVTHPHGLRHSYARELHDEGYSVREIQLTLGHADLKTTSDYLQSIGCNEVIAKVTQRGW